MRWYLLISWVVTSKLLNITTTWKLRSGEKNPIQDPTHVYYVQNPFSFFSLFRALCNIENAQNLHGYFFCLKLAVETRATDSELLNFLFIRFFEFTQNPLVFQHPEELFAVDELHQRLFIWMSAKEISFYESPIFSPETFKYTSIYLQNKWKTN